VVGSRVALAGGADYSRRVKQHTDVLILSSQRGLSEITSRVHEVVRASGVREGLCTAFVRHTSASLVIQENADPSVRDDLRAFFDRLVPERDALFTHVLEGDDDMPAHVKAAILPVSLAIPVRAGALSLGTWQGIYLWEHRTGRQRREIVVHVLGE
jgi:secondary thiamine-phosphate synthase enzyme